MPMQARYSKKGLRPAQGQRDKLLWPEHWQNFNMIYVIHCNKCNRIIEKDKRETSDCPPKKTGNIDFGPEKMMELNPYTKKFDGTHFYPNVGKHFDSHKDYERYLKATGKEIVTDKKHDEDIGYCLRSGERKRSRTMYST